MTNPQTDALIAEARANLQDCPTAIIKNIEAVPGWENNTELITARAHASVLSVDIPYILEAATRQPGQEGDRTCGTCRFADKGENEYRRKCRRFPSQSSSNRPWTTTMIDDWCFEWSPLAADDRDEITREIQACPHKKSRLNPFTGRQVCDDCGHVMHEKWGAERGTDAPHPVEGVKRKGEGLRPCPFCGGRASYREGIKTGYVMCLGCEVMGPNIAEVEAVSAWNRRAPKAVSVSVEDIAQTIAETLGLKPTEADPHCPAWTNESVLMGALGKSDWLRCAHAILALLEPSHAG